MDGAQARPAGEADMGDEPVDYAQLREQVAGALPAGGRDLDEGARLRAYWEIGRLLDEHIGGRAAYGEKVVVRLAADLGVLPRTLYRARNIHQRLPEAAVLDGRLSWSHCRLLATLRDAQVRQALMDQALAGGWSVRQLEERLRAHGGIARAEPAPGLARGEPVADGQPAPAAGGLRPVDPAMAHLHPAAVAPAAGATRHTQTPAPPPAAPARGRPGTFRVVTTTAPDGSQGLGLDLGFGVRWPLAALGPLGKRSRRVTAQLAPGAAVELGTDDQGRATLRRVWGRVEPTLYTYPARLLGAEAGALRAELELGPQVRLVVTLRPCGLAGQSLEQAADIREPVVVRTHRGPPGCGYEADVYHLPGEGDPRLIAARGALLRDAVGARDPSLSPARVGPPRNGPGTQDGPSTAAREAPAGEGPG